MQFFNNTDQDFCQVVNNICKDLQESGHRSERNNLLTEEDILTLLILIVYIYMTD